MGSGSFILLLLAIIWICCQFSSIYAVANADDLKAIFRNRTILAFGDGMTKGYLSLSRKNTSRSYAVQLNRFLNKSSVPLYLSAKNSELTGISAIRLPKVLALPNQKYTKMVIITGGTTDLALNYNVSRILSNLLSMHKSVHQLFPKDPILTIAVAIPHLRSNNSKKVESVRVKVNEGLMSYARNCQHLVHYCNFDSEFNRTKEHLWGSDGIHMTEKGYDELGRLLYEEILKFAHRLSEAKSDPPKIMC